MWERLSQEDLSELPEMDVESRLTHRESRRLMETLELLMEIRLTNMETILGYMVQEF